MKFKGAKRDCEPCELRAQCLRNPERTPIRQVAIFLGRIPGKPETYSARMKRKIDTERGRHEYARRLGTVEPVFANIGHARSLKRFSLRSAAKVNTQWLLYCLVHNIGKGPGQSAERWQHLIAEGPTQDAEAVEEAVAAGEPTSLERRLAQVEQRLDELERELAQRGVLD